MKFGLALRRNAIPEWRSQYLDYDALKRYLKCIPFSAEKMSDEAALTPTEVAFDEKIRLEVQKANSFYELKLEDIIRSKILLVDKLRSLVPNESLAPDTLQNIYTLTTKSTVSNIFNRRKKKEYYALRKSLLEFYRGLLLLKNFQKLNYTCLLKILKKHDKVTGRQLKPLYLKEFDMEPIFSSRVLDIIISEIEYMYSVVFAEGDRHKAMASLRVPDSSSTAKSCATFSWGFNCGIFLTVIALFVYMFLHKTPPQEKVELAVLYAVGFLPIYFAALMGLCFAVWHKFRVNYRFIFEFNLRDNLSIPEYASMVSFFALFYALISALSLFGLSNVFAPWVHALFLALCMFSLLVLPLPIFYASSRLWLLRVLSRMLCLLYYEVKFRDFLLADILTSLVPFLRFPTYITMLATHSSIIPISKQISLIYPYVFLSLLPFVIRSFQCIRRLRDSGRVYPHGLNLLKYLTSLLTILLQILHSLYNVTSTLALSLFFGIFSTLFSLYWDLSMDWGFVITSSFPKVFFRQRIVFNYRILYYFAAFANFVIRFLWLYPLFISVSFPEHLVFVYFEALRRAIWVVFRIEHEHLNNCGELKAFKPIEGSDLFFQAPSGDGQEDLVGDNESYFGAEDTAVISKNFARSINSIHELFDKTSGNDVSSSVKLARFDEEINL